MEVIVLNNKMRRTLLIGLGGTGCQAILHAKKRFIESYGEVPRAVRFLVLDTADPSQLNGADGRPVTLDPAEFLKLSIREPWSLVRTNSEVQSWFPQGRIPIRTITSGASQVRALGRLALFGNDRQVIDAISARLSEVTGSRVERESGSVAVDGTDITVNIVASLAGGTGSGIFLDVAYLVASLGHLGGGSEVDGYLVMPDVFLGRPATDRVESNSYAALKELSYLMSKTDEHSFRFDGSHSVSRPPFSRLFLVNNRNVDALTYEHIEDITEFIGTAMWVSCTATGKATRERWDNVKEQIASADTWGGQPALFSSFGVAEMVFPRDWYAQLHVQKGALSLIERLSRGSESGVDAANRAKRLVETLELSSDSILAGVVTIPAPRMVPGHRVSAAEALGLLSRKDTQVSNFVDMVRADAEASLNQACAAAKSALASDLELALHGETLDLNAAISELNVLGELVHDVKATVLSLRSTAQNRQEQAEARYPKLREQANKTGKKLLGRRRALEQVMKEVCEVAREHCGAAADFVRFDTAVRLLDTVLSLAEAHQVRLDGLSRKLRAAEDDLKAGITRQLSEKVTVRPFVIELRPDYLADAAPEVRLDDLLAFLEGQGLTLYDTGLEADKQDIAALTVTEITDSVLKAAAESPGFRRFMDLTIEDILNQMPDDQIKLNIKRMFGAAAPLWQYDRGLVTGDRGTHTYCVFGVPDAQNSHVRDEVVKAALGSVRDYEVESVNDPNRIVCLKVESCLPAYAIYDVKRYRDRYTAHDPVTSHTNRDWVGLQDLCPAEEEQERTRVWALALALPHGWCEDSAVSPNLVYKRGPHYYAQSAAFGDKVANVSKLAQGRVEAYRNFIANPELVKETDQKIVAFVQKSGRSAVVTLVEAYIARLRQEAQRHVDEELLNQVGKELEVLEWWLRSERTAI
jgi:hypothetical protein